jgi:transcriptional regulator with GAF, ATPase, and Fis domain
MKATLLMHNAFADMVESRPRHGLALLEPLKNVLVGHGVPEGQLYSLISALHRISCNSREAVASAKIALDILVPLDSPRMLAIASSHMGAYLNAEGRFRQAETYHDLAVTTSERVRSVFQQAQASSNLAECLCRSGRLPESLAISSKIKRLAAITDNRDWMDICAGSIIETWINMGRYSEAYDSLKGILLRRRSSLPIYVKAQALYYFSWLHVELGDFKGAAKYLHQMARLANKQAPIYESEMARVLGICSEHKEGAQVIIRRLLRVHSELMGKRRPFQMCLTELRLAEECLKASDHASAQRWALRAIKLARAMPAAHLESLGHLFCGTALYRQACRLDGCRSTKASLGGDDEENLMKLAHSELTTGAELSRNAGTLEISWRMSALLAECEDQLGNHNSSIEHAVEAVGVLDELERMVPARFLRLYRSSSNRLTTRRKCRHFIQGLVRTPENDATELDRATEKHFATLYHVSSVLNRIRDTEELSVRIVESLAHALDMERARLYLVDSGGKLRLASEFSSNVTNKKVEDLLAALVTRTYEEGGVFITADARTDSRLKGTAFGGLNPAGTVFIASIKAYGKPIGALCCDSANAVDRIDSSRISFFGAFANMAAVAIDNSIAHKRLKDEAADLEQCLEHAKRGLIEILGDSAAAIELRQRIAMVARSPLDVLINGETGTGKELVARALHQCGRRAKGIFVAVDCGSLSDTLFESELFGYRKGAFTGASDNRPGLLESANGGVLFLDEISNLSLRLQAKLLRVLQEREVRRIGEGTLRRLDIQVIAATNRELSHEIRKGRFRRDLYYRLKSMEIRVPPLRERREDIPLLIEWFLSGVSQLHGMKKSLSPEACKRLMEYSYPGNIRELKNNIESSYYLAKDRVIDVSDLQPELRGTLACQSAEGPRVRELYEVLREGRGTFEEAVKGPFLKRILTRETVREIIRLALIEAGGKYREAFRLLRIPDSSYSVMMLFLKRHRCYLDFRPFRQK